MESARFDGLIRNFAQIRSRRHIEVCPLTEGYLEKIELKEGQAVKEGEVLFKILPTLSPFSPMLVIGRSNRRFDPEPSGWFTNPHR